MSRQWWIRGLSLFALTLPIGTGLMAFGAIPFIRGLGMFILADAAAGVLLCALALRVLYPAQWGSQLRRLRAKASGVHEGAERLRLAIASPQPAAVG